MNLQSPIFTLACMLVTLIFIFSYAIPAAENNDAAMHSPPVSKNIITANALAGQDDDYKAYWEDNKNAIGLMFNSYIDKFNQTGCIDHAELRSLLAPDNAIRDAAYNITGHTGDDVEIAYLLHRFVYNDISYSPVDEELGAGEILAGKVGDCSEKSVLLASLLSSRGIQAYVADGNKHRYVFAKLDGTWVPIDPTSGDFYYAYKKWNSFSLGNSPYIAGAQAFIFDKDKVLFDKNWCQSGAYI